MKKHASTILLVLVFLAGCGLLCYPIVSDLWNYRHQSRAIAGYDAGVNRMDGKDYSDMLEAARAYNKSLVSKGNRYYPTEEEDAYYRSLLKTEGSDVMAVIDIPSIQVYLPVYHGTNEDVLQSGVGHLEGTSLPVGGNSTHCVLSGHRGLPSAKLFSNLNLVEEGDRFYIHVLGETLAYEVDQISVVEPDEIEELNIEKDRDYCTLVTCTPYGINTHRLLVRGNRLSDAVLAAESGGKEESGGTQSRIAVDSGYGWRPERRELLVLIPVPVLAGIMLFVGLRPGKKKRKGGERDGDNVGKREDG